MAELSLWLDSYDDIYSDFDSRNYLRRRISEDFLFELRKELKYKGDHAKDMLLLLPQDRRDASAENIIADSLQDFFKQQFHLYQEKCRNKVNQGLLLMVGGITVMVVNAWINFQSRHSFPLTALRILLEPAGWFLMWAALDFLFYNYSLLKREREFYRELQEIHIHFKSS